jgi:hypothetical protein
MTQYNSSLLRNCAAIQRQQTAVVPLQAISMQVSSLQDISLSAIQYYSRCSGIRYKVVWWIGNNVSQRTDASIFSEKVNG